MYAWYCEQANVTDVRGDSEACMTQLTDCRSYIPVGHACVRVPACACARACACEYVCGCDVCAHVCVCVHLYHGSAGLVVAREGLEFALDDHGVRL